MNDDQTLDLLGYFRRLARFALPALLLGAMVAAGLTFLGAGKSPASVTTQAHVVVDLVQSDSTAASDARAQLASQVMRTYVALEDAPTWTEAVAKRTHGKYTAEQVASHTTIFWGGGSMILAVRAEAPTEAESKKLADEAAQALVEVNQQLTGTAKPLAALKVVQPAFVPSDLPAPKTGLMAAAKKGIVLGLATALVAAVGLEWFSSRRRRRTA